LKLIAAIFLWFSAFCYADQKVADIHMRSGGAYEVRGLIGGYTVDMLIDTGASISVISVDLKNKLHITPYKHSYVLLADGRRVRVGVYHVPFLIISGCVIKDFEAVALPNNLNILGISAMNQMQPISLWFKDEKMYFGCKGM
jgi:predicted aspartyl protease